MKLDPTVLRTLDGTDVRVLEAIEKGMKDHALVPVPLIVATASLRHGGANKSLSRLLRDKLLSHDRSCGYDGYRITTAGYDILALYHLKKRGFVAGLGDRIGTGKESDVYLGVQQNGQYVVLKFHRLGRTSFRNVKKLRDYAMYNGKEGSGRRGTKNSSGTNTNASNSWLFFSRTSAHKEFAFLQALYDVDYPTPTPVTCHRHIVVMSLIRGVPLYQLPSSDVTAEQAASIGKQATGLAVRLARHGLIHCDLNEFNLMVDMSGVQQKNATKSELEKKIAAEAGDDAHSMANGTTVSRRTLQSNMYKHGDPDPYVRHSGLSVAASKTPGMLSARGAWESTETAQFAPRNEYDDSHMVQNRQGGRAGDEEDDDHSIERLENGQPKPVVTLIDFPQMVSTKHPNAKELYERDMTCLYRFFTHKWQCQIPVSGDGDVDDDDDDGLCLTWGELQRRITRLEREQRRRREERKTTEGEEGDELNAANVDDPDEDIGDLCLASKAQLRLDEELKASGYSDADAYRDSELYYYATGNVTAIAEEGKDSDQNTQDKPGNTENNPRINENAESEDGSDQQSTEMEHQIIVSPEQLVKLTREQLQEQAKLRVQQQLEAQKRKGRQKGAFRKRNSNKTYAKGKRVFADNLGI